MTWALILVGLYATPAGLLVFFLAYTVAKRLGLQLLEVLLTVVGAPCDVFNNYTWFRVLGPWPWAGRSWPQRTVTARVTRRALDGSLPALRLARFLNWCDPGHCPGVQ